MKLKMRKVFGALGRALWLPDKMEYFFEKKLCRPKRNRIEVRPVV